MDARCLERFGVALRLAVVPSIYTSPRRTRTVRVRMHCPLLYTDLMVALSKLDNRSILTRWSCVSGEASPPPQCAYAAWVNEFESVYLKGGTLAKQREPVQCSAISIGHNKLTEIRASAKQTADCSGHRRVKRKAVPIHVAPWTKPEA